MDPAVIVALVSVGTAAVTTAGGVLVAFLTNRREAENSAEDAMEMTLRERIALRDEQIAALERKVANRDDKIHRLEAELERRVIEEAKGLSHDDT
jgi:uncharacterized protein (DUF3084 family)